MVRFVMRTELDINELKEVEEFKSLIPDNNQYEELKKSVKENGFLFPLIINKNREVIDGYTRLRIARELGISRIPVEIYETNGREEDLDLLLSLNVRRRQLTKDEIIMVVDKVHEMKKIMRTNSVSEQITVADDYIIIGDKKIPKLTNVFPNAKPSPEVGKQKYLFVFNQTGSTSSDSNNFVSDAKISITPDRNSLTSNDQNSITPDRNSLSRNETISTSELPPGSDISKTSSIKQESREIKEELERLVPNIDINEQTIEKYLRVKGEAPWLIKYIGDERKGKIGITKAYDVYRLLKRKDLLDLDKRVPGSELEKLIVDKYGRKVLERDDLLRKVLNKEMTVDEAVNAVMDEKGDGSGKSVKSLKELESKGYVELPFEAVLVKLDGKCYLINAKALSELENGTGKWDELTEFLMRHNLITGGEGRYSVQWEVFGRCAERNPTN